MLSCAEFPVLLGSATTGVGIDRLADYICELGPSPADRPTTVIGGTERVPVPADASGTSVAYVFKTVADQFVGQVSLFKVLSGTVHGDDRLVNSATSTEERLHGLFHLRGKEHLTVNQVVAGDIGGIAKLAATPSHSTLAAKGSPVRVEPPATPSPNYQLALEPLTQSDDDKLSDALSRLVSEDPTLRVVRSEETHQTVLCGAGDTHVAVALERLARKFGVNVSTAEVKVPYRETISANADAEGKVKKQSGGHGQYAVVNMRVAPHRARQRDRSSSTRSSAGRSPATSCRPCRRASRRRWRPAARSGSRSSTSRSSATTASTTPSTRRTWRSARRRRSGSRRRWPRRSPVVLEPVSLVTVNVPESMQGDVLGDINSRRGRVSGSNPLGDGHIEITAMVPAGEIQRYAVDLRSMTGGRGSFEAVHDHYDVLPSHLTSKLVAERSKAS